MTYWMEDGIQVGQHEWIGLYPNFAVVFRTIALVININENYDRTEKNNICFLHQLGRSKIKIAHRK